MAQQLAPKESTLLSSPHPQHPMIAQEVEESVPNPHATANSLRVEDEPQLMHGGTEQQHDHDPSLLSGPGDPDINIQHSIGEYSASNIITPLVETKHRYPLFSLSDPMQSSIMLRRNARAESASAVRSSTSHEGMQDVDPRRVRQIIDTMDLDDRLSEILFKVVIATAPFHKTQSLPIPTDSEENNPRADALRETLGRLTFSPKSPTGTAVEEGPLASNSTENPTGNLLFDTDAAEALGSNPIESRSDSPPLLWSTAAVEESLDPNAEEPRHYTVAEFVNTIIEQGIQVESVTDEDWLIEDMRVYVLNQLKNDASGEELTAEEHGNEAVVAEDETSKPVKGEGDTHASNITSKGDSNKVTPREESNEQSQAEEDSSTSDLQRWGNQGPDGWLKRDDGTGMNEEEIDEECARWDAMVMKARREDEVAKTPALPGTNVASEEVGQSMSEKRNRKKLEAGKTAKDKGEDFLDGVKVQDENNEDILSQDSALYTASVYSEHDDAEEHGNAASQSTTSSESNPGLVREFLDLMDESSPAL